MYVCMRFNDIKTIRNNLLKVATLIYCLRILGENIIHQIMNKTKRSYSYCIRIAMFFLHFFLKVSS